MPRDAATLHAETREPPCPHPEPDIIWHPAKVLPGSADGRHRYGHHVAQGGICRRCRVPMLRLAEALPFGPAEPVAGASPVPRVVHGRRRYG